MRTGSQVVLACVLVAVCRGCGDDEGGGDREIAPDSRETAAEDTIGDAPELSDDVPDVIDDVPDSIDDVPEVIDDVPDVPDGIDDEVVDSTEPLDPDLIPCERPQYWPYSVLSASVPVRVHYRERADVMVAREILAILEHVWSVEVDVLGFEAPLSDDGTCGPDAALDVFVWRDSEEVYVDIWEHDDATPWDDGSPYMVVDPWGPYGGDELRVTLAHEFNHMCQAVHDWSDAAWIYEATSTFIEDVVYDDDDSYLSILYDFQGHPDWALDRDDGYDTWYMYGGMLWLVYLRDRFFAGDAGFVADLWRGMRSPADDNEPDFVDSIEALLEPFAMSFADTVVELARWRWFVHTRDDARHFEEGAAFSEDALPKVAATLDASGDFAEVRPMMLGTSYVDIVAAAGGERRAVVTLETDVPSAEVWFVVQALPGLERDSDGDTLTLPATVGLTEVEGRLGRTLAVTALPGMEGDIDPDTRTDERFPVTVRVSAP